MVGTNKSTRAVKSGVSVAARKQRAGKVLAVDSSEKKKSLRQRLKFTRSQFARLTAISERTLASLEQGQQPGESAMRSLKQLERLVEALEEVMRQEFVGEWLKQPNEAFEGLKPLELIERGEADRIWRMVYELKSGVAF